MTILLALILTTLIFIAWTDWQTYLMPDRLLIILFLMLTLVRILDPRQAFPYLITAIILLLGALMIRLILMKTLGRDVLGIGDVKLMPILGLGLQPEDIAPFLIWAGILGIATHFIKSEEGVFPFGPAIILAFLITFIPKYYY